MPWNGSGLFTRLYNFSQDAIDGIKILASKQDDEWANVVQGLNNTICRDGQGPPTTDINWNAKKIINLANGVAPTDAATVGQILNATNEYIPENNTISYISPTSFKVAGTNQTGRYHAGRRLLTVLSVGPTYPLATVLSSVYTAPDTIVTITPDAAPLDANLIQIWYGLLAYSFPGPSYLSPRSAVFSFARGGGPYPGAARVNYENPTVDLLAEYDSSLHQFKAHYSGVYRIAGSVVVQVGTAASNTGFQVYLSINDVSQPLGIAYGNIPGTAPVGAYLYLPYSSVVSLTAGDTLYVAVSMSPANYTVATNSHFDLTRLR